MDQNLDKVLDIMFSIFQNETRESLKSFPSNMAHAWFLKKVNEDTVMLGLLLV